MPRPNVPNPNVPNVNNDEIIELKKQIELKDNNINNLNIKISELEKLINDNPVGPIINNNNEINNLKQEIERLKDEHNKMIKLKDDEIAAHFGTQKTISAIMVLVL